MNRSDHSFVFAADFRTPEPGRVWRELQRRGDNMVNLGARYVCG